MPYDPLSTKGTAIEVAGTKVQLPADVYVTHVIATVLCMEGFVCPKAPVLALQYEGTEDTIGISSVNGEIYAYTPEQVKRWAWLYEQMGAPPMSLSIN